MRSRQFSSEEATGSLPLVSKIVQDVVRDYAELSDLAAEYKELRASTERGEETEGTLNGLKRRMASLSEGIDAYVAELTEIGCEIKDLRTGLVDFPSEMDGRRVYLCWQLGEEAVEHWHELTDGFAGRRPLPVTVFED